MKKFVTLMMLPILAAGLILSGCGSDVETSEATTAAATTDSHEGHDHAPAASADAATWHGTVVETMDAANYTYVLLDTGDARLWIAGPQTPVSVGEELDVPKGMLMPNFHSKALERDFAELYFVTALKSAGAAGGMPAGHPGSGGGMGAAMGGATGSPDMDNAEVSGVEKAEGGYTVEEMFTRPELAGQTVKVRGQVVKFTPNIMGTNWIHLQDGTGSGETVDLTVTSLETVAPGDVITVEGKLIRDKDFGAGYFYKAIIEGASVTR